MKIATAVSFGSKTPTLVLQLLTDGKYAKINLRRSSALELALLAPPYRTFLDSGDEADEVEHTLIYCLPTMAEYLSESGQIDAEFVRKSILCRHVQNAVVYDARRDLLVEGFSEVLAAFAQLDRMAITIFSGSDGELKTDNTVLIVGSGGREHALAVAIAQSPLVKSVVCCPGNGGTAKERNPKIKNLGANQNTDTVIGLVKQINVDLVVVGPEQPLVDGLVDAMTIHCPSVKIFGPTKAAAELEASKV